LIVTDAPGESDPVVQVTVPGVLVGGGGVHETVDGSVPHRTPEGPPTQENLVGYRLHIEGLTESVRTTLDAGSGPLFITVILYPIEAPTTA
jgi:hypothetical protein